MEIRINGLRYKLANTFLTCTGEVGMQWGRIDPRRANMEDSFTIWLHNNVLKSSSTHPIPIEVYGKALDYYERNYGRMLAF